MANGLIQSWVVSRAHFKSDNWDVRLMKLMSFSSLLRREIWISSVVSMIAASIVTLLVAFVYLHLASVDKTEKMERVVQVNVERYLTRGWVDHNLQQVYQEMRKQFPDVYPDEATTPDALIQLSTKRLRVPTTAGVNDN